MRGLNSLLYICFIKTNKHKNYQVMKNNTQPQHYLSFSERGWSLISQGMPLCAPTDKATAEQVAKKHNMTLPSVYWNGMDGKFTDH